MIKKLVVFLLLFSFVGLLFVPFCVGLDPAVITVTGGSTTVRHIHAVFPSSSVDASAYVGGAYSATQKYITAMSFMLSKVGSPDAEIRAFLVFPSISHVDAVSINSISAEDLTESSDWYTFYFVGDVYSSPSNAISWGVYCDSAVVLDGNNYVGVVTQADGDTNGAQFYSSGWVENQPRIIGVVYGVDSEPTPSPSPSPSPSSVSTVHYDNNVGVVAVPSYYMIVLVLFAVVAVLAGIYVGFERDGGNKGVAFLFALVALVIFVVLIVGYLSG